eukprot:gb/GEZN01007447.1/.p1 GENE.gb/GEZN01007447.1/~~gb/GEZN01007447.1/.p1  ORF type:complete len:396 (-),score=43.34 gb/GEZN01007447.1/:350-1492(-)
MSDMQTCEDCFMPFQPENAVVGERGSHFCSVECSTNADVKSANPDFDQVLDLSLSGLPLAQEGLSELPAPCASSSAGKQYLRNRVPGKTWQETVELKQEDRTEDSAVRKVNHLKEACKERGIPSYSNLNKLKLIEVLDKWESLADEEKGGGSGRAYWNSHNDVRLLHVCLDPDPLARKLYTEKHLKNTRAMADKTDVTFWDAWIKNVGDRYRSNLNYPHLDEDDDFIQELTPNPSHRQRDQPNSHLEDHFRTLRSDYDKMMSRYDVSGDHEALDENSEVRKFCNYQPVLYYMFKFFNLPSNQGMMKHMGTKLPEGIALEGDTDLEISAKAPQEPTKKGSPASGPGAALQMSASSQKQNPVRQETQPQRIKQLILSFTYIC